MRINVLVAMSSIVYTKIFIKALNSVYENLSLDVVSSGDKFSHALRQSRRDIVIVDADFACDDVLFAINATRAHWPSALLIATGFKGGASVNRRMKTDGDAAHLLIGAGADVFIEKPIAESYDENLKIIKTELEKVSGARFRLKEEAKRAKNGIQENLNDTKKIINEGKKFDADLVLIAASTGGPYALEKVLPRIKPDFDSPILIVQHMPPHFTESMAKNMNKKCAVSVVTAEGGDKIMPGVVCFAPGGRHMTINKDMALELDEGPLVNGVRPSADVLFESVAKNFYGSVLCVILTGMGRDGADGVAFIKEKMPCRCLTQSEKTCVVYGMPRAVEERGLSDFVLDIDEIAGKINACSNLQNPIWDPFFQQ